MKKITFVLILFLGSLSTFGQKPCQFTLTCLVLGADTGLPLAEVNISIDGNTWLKTNSLGKATISNICPNRLTLKFSKEGYNSLSSTVTIQSDSTLTYYMHPLHQHLDVVDVVGHSHASNALSRQTITAERRTESQGKNLGEVLTDVAGMTVLRSGNMSKPVLNGLYGSRLLLINNAVRHESQQWGIDHAPEIDPFAAEEITVIKNADAVRYGPDALAGVVLINPEKIDTNRRLMGKIASVLQSNGRSAALHAEIEGASMATPDPTSTRRKGLWAYRLGLTAKKSGNIKTANYYLGNTGANELNFNGTLQYHIGRQQWELAYSRFGTTLGVFEGAHIGSKEDILERIARGRPFEEYNFSYDIQAPRQVVSHDLAKLRWRHDLGINSTIEATYSLQRNHRREYDLRRVASDNLAMADMVLTTQALEIVARQGGNTIGVSGSLQVNNNTPGTGTTPIIPNFDNHTIGVFATNKTYLGPHLIELGLRYDYKYFDVAGYRFDYNHPNADGSISQYLLEDRRDFHNLSGVAGFSYNFTPNFFWKSHLGLAWRAPSANELYSDGVHHGTGTYEVGDPNLKSEKGLKWVNNLHFDNGWFIANVDLFAQSIWNYTYTQPNPDSLRQTIRGTFPLFQHSQTDAWLYGTDVSLTLIPSTKVEYAVSLAMVIGREHRTSNYLTGIPSDRLQQSVRYRFGEQAYLRLSHQFVAKQHRYVSGSDYAEPPAAYHLWNIVGSYDILRSKTQKVQILAGVENIFNTAYKDYMDRFRYYAHLQGRNFTLKLNYNF